MTRKKTSGPAEIYQDIMHDGVRLTVIATRVGEQEWELAVENEHGLRSIWYELFTSGRQALAEGVRSVEQEGAASFADATGFEYLLDSSRTIPLPFKK